jgi:hypothetical protein
MPDKINYIARVISVEYFGEPTIWKVVARIVGSHELFTLTLPVKPNFTIGEQIGVRVESA